MRRLLLLPVLFSVWGCDPDCDEVRGVDSLDDPTPAGKTAAQVLAEVPRILAASMRWAEPGACCGVRFDAIGPPTTLHVTIGYDGGPLRAHEPSHEEECGDEGAVEIGVTIGVSTDDGRLAEKRADGTLRREASGALDFDVSIPVAELRGSLVQAVRAGRPEVISVSGTIEGGRLAYGEVWADCDRLAAFPDEGEAGEDLCGADAYRWVLIVDESDEEDMTGAPGVDVCGVVVTCNGTDMSGGEVRLEPGTGAVCGRDLRDCGADRSDPQGALDACKAGPAEDGSVSLGVGGMLAVGFDDDLRGCAIEVVEDDRGPPAEKYEVFVCADERGDECLGGAAVYSASRGGLASFDVPVSP